MPQTARHDHLVSVRAIDQDPISSLRHHSPFIHLPFHTTPHHTLPYSTIIYLLLVPTRHLRFHINDRYYHAATTHSLPSPAHRCRNAAIGPFVCILLYICCLALRPPTQISHRWSFERPAISQQWLIRRRLKASTHRAPHLLFFPAIARGTTRLSGTTISTISPTKLSRTTARLRKRTASCLRIIRRLLCCVIQSNRYPSRRRLSPPLPPYELAEFQLTAAGRSQKSIPSNVHKSNIGSSGW